MHSEFASEFIIQSNYDPERTIEEPTSPMKGSEETADVERDSADQGGEQKGSHTTKEQTAPCSPEAGRSAMEIDANSTPKGEHKITTPDKPRAAEYVIKKPGTPKDDRTTCSIMKATAVPMRER